MLRQRAPSSTAGIGVVGVLAGAALAVGLAACAGLVGANFGDEYLRGDGGAEPGESDAGSTVPASDGAVGPAPVDSSIPPVPAEGGVCPAGLTDCGGLCFDLTTSPAHCGKCATSCPSDPNGAGVCVSSHCTFACDEGWEECAGGCCGTGTDASSPPTVDAGPPASDGGPSTDPGIACGSTHCPVASNSFCCASTSGDACDTNLADSCPQIFCDDAVECAGAGGGVCCYDTTTQTFCEATCSAGQKQLCDPLASGECTGGKQCTGTLSPGTTSYTICQ